MFYKLVAEGSVISHEDKGTKWTARQDHQVRHGAGNYVALLSQTIMCNMWPQCSWSVICNRGNVTLISSLSMAYTYVIFVHMYTHYPKSLSNLITKDHSNYLYSVMFVGNISMNDGLKTQSTTL